MKNKVQSTIDFEMLPFVMKELVAMVMKKKALPLQDALYYIYSSELYESLLNEKAKTWYLSTPALYEWLEKEKAERRKKSYEEANGEILLFQMFCIEHYRVRKDISFFEALNLFSEYRVFRFLEENFEMLHTQDADYMVDTIVTYVKKMKKQKK